MTRIASANALVRICLSRIFLFSLFFFFFSTASTRVLAQYNPGKLAVLVSGDGTVYAAGTAAPVFIKEFDITGTGQTGTLRTTLPTTAVGGTTAVNRALTQNISAASEGFLSLSTNRQFLTLVGYNVSVGTAAVGSTVATTFPTNTRVVGKIGVNAVADTRTTLFTSNSSNVIRSAATVDGTAYWAAGVGGITYVADANVTTFTSLNATNVRGIGVFNNQLYTSASSTGIRLATVGSGLPITTGQTLTNLSGFATATTDPYSFVFLNIDGIAGPDIVYVASSNVAPTGIVKYVSTDQGATWTSKGALTGFGFGVTAVYNSCTGNADLYITSSTTGSVKPTFLYKYTDNSPATSSLSAAISSGTLLATAAANTSFGGVAFTPTTTLLAPALFNVTGGGSFCSGDAGVAVSLSSSETGVSYQLKNGAADVGAAISGTGSAISFGNQTAAGTYTVVATNTLTGCTTTMSGNAVVTINPLTVITVNPTPLAICTGAAASFSVNATGAGTLTYQWRKNLVDISGATGSTYSIPATVAGDAASYDVVVTGSCGSATSAAAILSLNIATAITVNPAPLTICEGAIASFSVTATGTGTLTYQWRKNTVNISGATGSTYSIPVAVAGDAGNYDVVVTGTCGTATSTTVVLSVTAIPSITGTTPGTRCGVGTVVLGATGTGAAVNWYADVNATVYLGSGNTFTTPQISTSTTYYAAATPAVMLGNTSIPPSDNWFSQRGIAFNATSEFTLFSAQYYSSAINTTNQVHVVLQNSSGTELYATTLQIAQGASPGWYTMNLNWFITPGNGYRLLADFSAGVHRDLSANYSLPAYNNLSTAGIITSGIEFDGSISANTYNYFHNITIAPGCNSATSPVTATITPPPAISVSPANYTTCSGNSSQLSVSSGNDPNYTYTWTSVPAGFTATGSGPFTVAPTVSTTYFVSANDNTTGNPNSGCFVSGSAVVNITTNNILSVSPTASPAVVCMGANTQLNANAVYFPPCTPVTNCTFPDMISNVSFGGINNTTGCNGAATGGFTYFASPNPGITAGTAVPLSVTTGGDVEGAAVWIDYNQNGIFEAFELVLNGYLNTNPATYSATVNIPLTALNGLTRMRVRCTYGQNPNTLTDPPCSNFPFGETEDYAISINGGIDRVDFTYNWSTNPSYLDATNISNPFASGITAAQTYTVTVTDQATGCVKTASVNVPLSSPSVVIAPTCNNGSSGIQLTANATPGAGGSSITSYQWFLDGISISGATASDYVATVTGSYIVIVTNNIGCSVTSTAYIISGFAPGLNGTYTINSSLPASCTNYVSLASAIADLNTKGVSGNVIFNINSGHTETAPAGGLVINYCGLSTALKPSAEQTVTFQGGTTAALITAPVGTSSTDGIIKLVGADWITFDKVNVQESAANTTATTQMEWGYALLKCDGNNGSNHNTISNCSVTLNKANTASAGIYSGNHLASSTTGLVYSGTASNIAQVDSSRNGNNRFLGNSIQNVYVGISLNGNASSSGALSLNDTLNVVGVSGQGNAISNFGGSSVAAIGITETNQRGYSVVGNDINGGAGNTGAVTGIQMNSGVWGEAKNNTISLSSGATTASVIGITCAFNGGNASNPNTVTITGNFVYDVNFATATTGNFTAITSSAAGTGSVVNISNNTVSNNTLTGTGSFIGIINAAVNPGLLTMNNNNVYSNTKSGSGTMTLLDAGSATTTSMNSNQVSTNQLTGANGTLYCTKASTSQITFNGNFLFNNGIPATSGTTASSVYGYYNLGFPTIENITSNKIHYLSIGGTNSSTGNIVYGMITNSITSAVKNISGNEFAYFSMETAGAMRGISQDLGAVVNIYRNKINELSNTSSNATVLVEGIRIGSGTNVKVYNNVIGNLRATATSAADAVRGISLLSTTANSTLGVYFNSIYLAGTSTGTGFGSSGIFHTANATATTAALDMRNNIVMNVCTPTGTGRAVAYRRSSTALANFSALSNNNIYYVESGANNHIFSDGTNNLDMPAYKSFAGVSPRETYSGTENVHFQDIIGFPDFLQLATNIPTFAESRAQPISGITDDFFGTVRNTLVPDIGAHEGNFMNAAPIINSFAITPAAPQCVATARTITVAITAGVNPVTLVTLNYSFAGIAQSPITMTGGPVNYTATLPAALSPNLLVSWSVAVTDGFSSSTVNGGSFTDAYLTGMSIAASANQASICNGGSTVLSGIINTSIPAAPAASSYCASTHTSGCSGDNITKVVLGTINNTTSGCGGTSHYSYFNGGGTQTTGLAATVSNTLSVSFGTDGNQFFGAWIDYDHNGVYDASEFLGASGNAGANGTASVSFVVPVSASNGLTHLRIVGGNDAVVLATQACGASSSVFGETQDYDVTITGAEPLLALPVVYTWKDLANNTVATANPATINPVESGSYTLTATDANGCSIVSAPVAVTVNRTSVAASGPTSFCVGGSVTLSANTNNPALQFDGLNDYAEATNVTSLPLGNTARTMEAWLKTTQTTTGVIFNWGTTGNNQRCGLLLVNSRLYFVGQFNDLPGNIIINDGQWHHVAASFDGTSLTLYVDGILDVSSSRTLSTSGSILRIGRRASPDDGEYFQGEIDEVRIWNIARTQSAIQLDKNAEIPVNTAGLVAYYKLNEGTGTDTYNAVNGSNPATLYNSPVWDAAPATPFTSNAVGYLWSNGATTSSITVGASGNYSVQVTYPGSVTCTSQPITVKATVPYVFVDGSIPVSGDGSSWATAYKTLQEALESCGVQEIWVKSGTYLPTKDALGDANPTDPRDKTFHLVNGVRIYGGFNGTETLLSQRDPVANLTILSGDFNNDDVVTGTGASLAITNNVENAYHVLFSISDLNTTIIDGFTVRGGNANGTTSAAAVESFAASRGRGGGMVNGLSSPVVNNMIFTGNSSTIGGGMYNSGNPGPTITNCTFSLNLAPVTSAFAGGMCNINSSPVITNCTFTGNRNATQSGGAMYNQNSFPAITGSAFNGNASVFGGAILNNTSSLPVITNCSFSNNTSSSNGGAIFNANTSNTTITGCTFNNNISGANGGAINNSTSSNPTVTNCSFTGNQAQFGAAVNSNAASPVYNSCRFIANMASLGGGAANLDGTANLATFNACIFQDNKAYNGSAIGTGGAIQLITAASAASITNCVFTGNQALGSSDDGGGAIMVYGGTVTLMNSTIAGSVAATRGGAISIIPNTAVLNITNTILWNNTAPVNNDIENSIAATVNISYSMLSDAACPANVNCGAGMIYNTDPLFVNAADLDGADDIWGTADDGLSISCSSPAYNTGNNAGAAATDITGETRPQFSIVDMGAYESTIPVLPVSVSITVSPGNTICAGSAVTFTALPVNGGSNPSYQWYNGVNPAIGETGSSYTSTTLVNGDVISVRMTSDITPCSSGNPAVSNSITMVVNPLPAAVINASGPLALCTGESVTLSTPVNGGSMLLFDGNLTYLTGPDDVVPVTGDYTVSVWAKQLNSHPGQFSEILAQGRNLYLGPDNNGIIRAGDSWPNTGVAFPTDQQWHHYALVRTNTNTYLYLDGNLAATKGSPIPSPGVNGPWPHNLMIGSQWFPGEIFDGYVDELQVWNTALTQTQIQSGMHISQVNNTSGLVAYFNFNEGTGSVTTDVTANGYVATLINNPVWTASTALPSIQWNVNGNPISGATANSYVANQAGNYTVTLTSNQGCTATSGISTVTVNNCNVPVALNLGVFLEGFYMGEGLLQPNLSTVEISVDGTESDTITVNLWSPANLANTDPDYSAKAVLHTDGTAIVQFPAAVNDNSYYIAVRHRNHIETWSHDPVLFAASTSYDFRHALNAAYDDGANSPMKALGDGNFGLYAGDNTQDGAIDGTDMNIIDNEIGFFGYNVSDINGDGGTDGLDMNYIDNNSQLGLFFARPY